MSRSTVWRLGGFLILVGPLFGCRRQQRLERRRIIHPVILTNYDHVGLRQPTAAGKLTGVLKWHHLASNSSINPSWPALIFLLAMPRSKNSARSISGNSICRPDFGGHSIVNVLLLMAAGSQLL